MQRRPNPNVRNWVQSHPWRYSFVMALFYFLITPPILYAVIWLLRSLINGSHRAVNLPALLGVALLHAALHFFYYRYYVWPRLVAGGGAAER